MRIRQIDITNFRGIQHMSWLIPKDRNLICLIGPGDSGKSSILDAIHLALGDRWNPAIADTDFYEADVTTPVVIRCVVSDLPNTLMKESACGLWLSGIDDEGKLYQDPEDGTDPALIVQLRVDDALEPVWTIERLEGGDSSGVSSVVRREFATFKVDDRTDIHLRWTRTSALGRISAAGNSTGGAGALAARAARDAISSYKDDELTALTGRVQAKLNEVGCGTFEAIQAGLDTSLSSAGGNLALYESSVPLTNYGLGSKRLAGLAVQQLAASDKSIVLMDEIEHGLEPHRLVRLLQYMRLDTGYSQVFVTTHSPVAVEQANTDNLAVVRNDGGVVCVKFLPEDTRTLRLRRSRPSSFLGRRIVVAEGRTEEGLLLEVIRREDERRHAMGLTDSAGIGSVVQDSQGGSEVPLRARALHDLGYDVAMFLDNDVPTINTHVDKAVEVGVKLVRWDAGNNTERQLISSLDLAGLSSLLELGTEVRNTRATVLNDLKMAGLDASCLDVGAWVEGGQTDEATARQAISKAIIDAEWFKSVDNGRVLGGWILDHMDDFTNSTIREAIQLVTAFVYPGVELQTSGEREDHE